MGASEWQYWVPYREDINKVLQELRQDEFERGKPYKLDERNWIWQGSAEEFFLGEFSMDPDLKSLDDVPEEELDQFRRMKAMREPSNIKELLEWSAEEGTHSIMDMTDGVTPTPEYFAVSPLSSQELERIFGTDRPSRRMVEEKTIELRTLRRTQQGIYVTVYKDDVPDEIFFIGASGD